MSLFLVSPRFTKLAFKVRLKSFLLYLHAFDRSINNLTTTVSSSGSRSRRRRDHIDTPTPTWPDSSPSCSPETRFGYKPGVCRVIYLYIKCRQGTTRLKKLRNRVVSLRATTATVICQPQNQDLDHSVANLQAPPAHFLDPAPGSRSTRRKSPLTQPRLDLIFCDTLKEQEDALKELRWRTLSEMYSPPTTGITGNFLTPDSQSRPHRCRRPKSGPSEQDLRKCWVSRG